MIDEDDLYTQPETPNKRAGYLFPEALLRQFLAYQFGQISRSVDDPKVTFLEELFHKAGADVVTQVKKWWRENPNIPVSINYPRNGITLPFVAVVNAGEQELAEETVMGDYGGTAYYGTNEVAVLGDGGTPKALYTREVLTLPLSHVTKVFVGADDPNLVTYLYHVIMALLLQNKLAFDKYGGLRKLTISGSDLENHPELFPEFAYFKVISLSYSSQFDVPQAKKQTVRAIDLSLEAFLFDSDGVTVK